MLCLYRRRKIFGIMLVLVYNKKVGKRERYLKIFHTHGCGGGEFFSTFLGCSCFIIERVSRVCPVIWTSDIGRTAGHLGKNVPPSHETN